MATQYLLSCECGQSVPVVTSQAGQQVTCSCGKKLTVPSLRAIRQLPTANDSTADLPSGTWGPTRGALFAIGAVMFLVGGVIAAHSWWTYSQAAAVQPSSQYFDESLAAIDGLTASEMLDTWHLVKEHGLEKPGTSIFAIWGGVAREKLHTLVASSTVALVGVLLAVISAVTRAR